MTEDLEEIKERLENVERYMNLLEGRVDLQESLMRLYTAGREPPAAPGADHDQPGMHDAARKQRSREDPELKGFDYLLRTILTHQGNHTTDLRKAVRGQEGLQWRLEKTTRTVDSVERMLREVQERVLALVDNRDAC